MLEIIHPRTTETITKLWHEFTYEDDRSAGFSFLVDADGNCLNNSELARRNYESCKTGYIDGRRVIDEGIHEEHYCIVHPAEGRCTCGRTVVFVLDGDVKCGCGRWYNSFGQELAHPSIWEEEEEDY